MHANPEPFFAAIRDNPDAPEPWLVFADWLDEHGQPARAEFVRVQIERERTPASGRDPALVRRALELVRQHGGDWQAGLPSWISDTDVFRRGFVTSVTVDAADFASRGAALPRLGPVSRVTLRFAADHMDAVAAAPHLASVRHLTLVEADGDSAVAALARSPFASGLWRLNVRAVNLSDAVGPHGASALGASPYLGGLRELDLARSRLGDDGGEALVAGRLAGLRCLDLSHCGLGNATAGAFARFPGQELAQLLLAGNAIGPAGATALASAPATASLETLDLTGNPVGVEGVRALAAANLPALRLLGLSDCRVSLAGTAIRPLSVLPPGLVELDLAHNPLGNAGAIWLADSPAVARLRSLVLAHAGITDEGARALEVSPHLRGLARLDLTGNPIGKAVGRALARRFGERVKR